MTPKAATKNTVTSSSHGYKIPELLAPAGSFEKMVAAIHYGADAVYCGGKKFSLRAHASNFSEKELGGAVQYAHEKNVKLYVTVNIFAHQQDLHCPPAGSSRTGKTPSTSPGYWGGRHHHIRSGYTLNGKRSYS
jgi:hypothetical protein